MFDRKSPLIAGRRCCHATKGHKNSVIAMLVLDTTFGGSDWIPADRQTGYSLTPRSEVSVHLIWARGLLIPRFISVSAPFDRCCRIFPSSAPLDTARTTVARMASTFNVLPRAPCDRRSRPPASEGLVASSTTSARGGGTGGVARTVRVGIGIRRGKRIAVVIAAA